jgi:hypothetical protein
MSWASFASFDILVASHPCSGYDLHVDASVVDTTALRLGSLVQFIGELRTSGNAITLVARLARNIDVCCDLALLLSKLFYRHFSYTM